MIQRFRIYFLTPNECEKLYINFMCEVKIKKKRKKEKMPWEFCELLMICPHAIN